MTFDNVECDLDHTLMLRWAQGSISTEVGRVIQAVDRALRILAVLQGGRRMSLGEIATAIDLAPSTVHGLVRTLLAHGMVQQEIDSGRYRLGPATLRLGNVYLDTLELRSRVAIWTEGLARRTGCAVRTAVLLFDEVVVVAHEPRPDGTRQMPEVGIVIPAHASALGKALLAFQRDGSADGAGDLRSMTGETITEQAVLADQLEQIRATGLAMEAEEAVLGECAAAAAVFDAAGEATGAIGLVVPAARWPLDPEAIDALRDTARTVSRELGAPIWPPRR
jgi:DNA-binding IclR family transcriptional regulator